MRGYLTTAYPVPPKTSGVPIDTDPDSSATSGTNGTVVPGLTKGGTLSSLFVAAATNNFHPKAGNLGLASGQKNITPQDVDNVLRSSFGTKGAY